MTLVVAKTQSPDNLCYSADAPKYIGYTHGDMHNIIDYNHTIPLTNPPLVHTPTPTVSDALSTR